MKRRIISILICIVMVLGLLPVNALAADGDTYVVAGVEELCGSAWDATDAANAMEENVGVYTKVYSAVAVGEYQFKVVRNGSDWIGDATGNNITFLVSQVCDVTVTYDPASGQVSVAGDGVGAKTELQVDAVYAVGNGDGSWLNGAAWDPAATANRMTEISKGVYQITYQGVECYDNYQVKFAANGSWSDNWGAGSYEPAEGTYAGIYNSSNNIIVNVTADAADVTLTLDLTGFDYATKTGATYTVEITEAAAPVEGVAIDEVNFPDQTFRDYVGGHFDKDGNGLLSEEEASRVNSIPEDGSSGTALEDLASLKGIEYFANLKELYCGKGYLTELDVSRNPYLEKLFCNNNDLTALDVSHNVNLVQLECMYNDISVLDVSHNPKLKDLKTIGNPLSQLDLSQNPELWALNVGDDNLTGLDISNNAKLRYLVIGNSKLTHVDTTNNTALGYVILNGTQMTSFDWSMSTDTSPYLDIYNNAYSVAVDAEGRFDLTTLPGSFDVSRTSDWVGGTVEGNILTADPGATEVSYTYDVGKGYSGQFKLVLEHIPQGTPIEVARAVEVTLPQIGQTASYEYSIVDGEGCVKFIDSGLDSAAWVVTDTAPASYVDVENGQWYYASGGEALVFEEGKYYTFVAWLDASEGYYLSETAVAFVNDIPAQLNVYNPYEFDVWATFVCEEPVELITQVTLDGSKLNVGDGKTPGSIVVADTEGYTVLLEELVQENGAAVTQFEGGKSYGYGISLKAKEGYAFAEDATVTITGITWQEIEYNEYISENEGGFIEDVWNTWVFIGYFDVKSVDPSNPATGDSANLVLWFSLIAASALAVLVIGKKKYFVK